MSDDTPKATFIERVASAAPKITPFKALLTLLASPFYLVGLVVGVLFVAGTFVVGAFKVGVADVRQRAAAKRGN